MAAIRAGVPLIELWEFSDVGRDGGPQWPDPPLGDDTPAWGDRIRSKAVDCKPAVRCVYMFFLVKQT